MVEADGKQPHGLADVLLADRERQNRLVQAGFLVLRFTWQDAVHRPDYVVEQVRRALDRRRAA